jgi:hypothetical protein
VVDGAENTVTNSGVTVTATIQTGTGSLTNATAIASSGIATFSGLTLTGTPGSFTLHFASGALAAVNSNAFTLTLGAAPTVLGISPVGGPLGGGTAVTITGTGFVSGATVTIGGTPATRVIWGSALSITAVTPSHAGGAVNVVVTNQDTQSGIGTGFFPYANAPTVTLISPAIGVLGGGTAVTITGTGFINGATVTIGGNPATSVIWGSATSITALTPSHAGGAVNVVVTNPDTQSGTGVGIFAYGSAYTIASADLASMSMTVPTGFAGPTTLKTVTLTRAGGAGSSPTGTLSVDAGTWTVTAGTNTTGTGDVTSSTPLTVTLTGATGDFALRLRGAGIGTYTATFTSGGNTLTTYVVTVSTAYTISSAVPSPSSASVATGYPQVSTLTAVALTRAGAAGSAPSGTVSVNAGTWTLAAGTNTTGGGTVTSSAS